MKLNRKAWRHGPKARLLRFSPVLPSRWEANYMRRIAFAFAGLLGAVTLSASPAVANPWWGYEIDPLGGRSNDVYGQQEYRPQAAPVSRQVVAYEGRHAPGTIVVSTSERRLYYVLGQGQAIPYPVGVGRPGFEWSGVK